MVNDELQTAKSQVRWSIFAFCIFTFAQTPEFDGIRAFDFLEMQCDLGPRIPGSLAIKQAREECFTYFTALADTVFWQDFTEVVPLTGDTVLNRNLVIQFGEGEKFDLLIGAHYDCRPVTDNLQYGKKDGAVLGANDAASGVAILMALAENLAENKPPIDVVFVLFDLEDSGEPKNSYTFCRGSQFFAKNLPIPKPEKGIILDMVADANAHFKLESNSLKYNPEWTFAIWHRAMKLELSEFSMSAGTAIFDDHIPLIQFARIPTVDIIDFEYPDATHRFWHTSEDIPENCSWETLQSVGTLMLDLIYNPVSE